MTLKCDLLSIVQRPGFFRASFSFWFALSFCGRGSNGGSRVRDLGTEETGIVGR